MSQKSALAEMKFPQYAVNLYGRVEQMNRDAIRVRLDTQPAGEHILRTGNEAQLMVVAKGVIYRASVSVLESALPRVTMRFCQPPSAVQRRNAHRRACDLTVALRTRGEGGYMGAWQEVQATDISISGMRVVLETPKALSGEVEAQFCLEGTGFSADETEAKEDETSAFSSPFRPMRVTARIAHRTQLADGKLAVGLAFRNVTSFNQLRLLRYVDKDAAMSMM